MSVASESVQVGRKVSAVKWLSGTAAFVSLCFPPPDNVLVESSLMRASVVQVTRNSRLLSHTHALDVLAWPGCDLRAGFSAAELGGSSRLLASGTWDDRDNRLQIWLVEGPTVGPISPSFIPTHAHFLSLVPCHGMPFLPSNHHASALSVDPAPAGTGSVGIGRQLAE